MTPRTKIPTNRLNMSGKTVVFQLNRLLSLKERCPFILCLDSISQSSYYMIEEFLYKLKECTKILISYETLRKPSAYSLFYEGYLSNISEISYYVRQEVSKNTTKKYLLVIDCLNYIADEDICNFIASLSAPNVTIVGTLHFNMLQRNAELTNVPHALSLLSYIAGTILEIEPIFLKVDEEDLTNCLSKLKIPANCQLNSGFYKVNMTAKRKSGRTLQHSFSIDTQTHEYTLFKNEKEDEVEQEDMFRDLTTFNLNTTTKQKLAKQQVELPFMQAQEALGSAGGAIVYQYEKEDDYDEEDPYEDPF